MFNDVNEVRLMGNITNDPDLRFTPNGSAVLSFGMATNRRYKKGDEWVDDTTFHNIVIWGQQAQSLAPRVKKGTRIYVAGRIQTRSWDGNDGKKQYKTEINVDTVSLISRYNEGTNAELGVTYSAPTGGGNFNANSAPADTGADNAAPEVEGGDSINPDDLPF